MSRMSKYNVFLRYSSKDKETVHALAERLMKDGLQVCLGAWAIEPRALEIYPAHNRPLVKAVAGSRPNLWCGLKTYEMLEKLRKHPNLGIYGNL